MSTGRIDFQTFLEDLKGKTVAIVYSFSNSVNAADTWYDRWKSDVVFFHGKGVEDLGALPRYIDIDLFLSAIVDRTMVVADFVINLHSGLLRIENWPIIAANASWRGIPVAPCASDIHIVGERKDVANALAAATRLKMPDAWRPDCKGSEQYVAKPRDLGMSRGVVLKKGSDVAEAEARHCIVQRYIPGVDATVAVLRLPSGDFHVINAHVDRMENVGDMGLLSEDLKVAERETGTGHGYQIAVDRALQLEIIELCLRIGVSAVYRFDFRVTPDQRGRIDRLCLENSFFLEANPTPTISQKSSYGSMFIEFLAGEARFDSGVDSEFVSRLATLGPEGALVALMLHTSVDSRDQR